MQQFRKLSLQELHSIRKQCNDLYYNTDNADGISDEVYDILIDVIQEKEQTGYQNPVGATVKHNHQCPLPYYLGSMNKYKEQNELDKWVKKFHEEQYIIEDKLDGVSCLLLIGHNNTTQLFTRGDGIVGTDISHFTPFFKNLPKKQTASIAIRGELIMKKSIFDSKYKDKFANARNMISGIVNSKTIKEEAQDIDFIPYEIINDDSMPLQKQFTKLNQLFPSIVNYKIIKQSEMNCEDLIRHLIEMKASSEYEIDGIIVHTSSKYKRNSSTNPSYAFAFKTRLDSNIIDSEVEYVEWNITKWNVYKPRIKIKPINLCGVTIQYTSGFNAKYIQDNSIGKGAIVSMTRSNDVIPYIVQVKKPGLVEFPEKFVWNATGVDIISCDDELSESEVKKLSSFFAEIGVKHVSDATILKMFDSGYDSLVKILNASKEDFSKIEGFGDKLSERTFNNIHTALEKMDITSAICASSCFGFGFGKKKIEKLFKCIPTFHQQEASPELLHQIMGIDGFSEKTATQAMNHLPQVKEFVAEISKFTTTTIKQEEKTKHLDGQIIVFSGFRDKDLEGMITTNGGIIGSAVSKNTTLVIAKDVNETSSKLNKARDYKIPIQNRDFFVKNNFI